MRKITVKYYRDGEFSHQYDEVFEHDDSLCCPHCSARSVWVEQSEGDYYVGETHICVDCGTSFCLPYFAPESKDSQDLQRVEGLKAQERGE